MKTTKSTQECKEFNEANKAAIEAGMVEAIEPNDNVLLREKQVAQEEAKRAQTVAAAREVLQQIWNALPSNVRACYVNPTEGVGIHWNSTSFQRHGYQETVEVEHYLTEHGNSYWRVVVGNYGNKKITKIGTVCAIDRKGVGKVVSNIQDAYNARQAQQDKQAAARAAEQRRQEFAKANPDFLETFGLYAYGSDWSVQGDDKVTIKYETYTVEQWREIALLRNRQQAEMRALKESFKMNSLPGGVALPATK